MEKKIIYDDSLARTDPYIRLWQTVIITLYRDLHNNFKYKNLHALKRQAITRKIAENYVLNYQDELAIVCDYAGLDYKSVYNKFLTIIKKNKKN